jgi:hypothetical protein
MFIVFFAGDGGGAAAAYVVAQEVLKLEKKFPEGARHLLRTVERGFFGGKTIVETPCEILDQSGDKYKIQVFDWVSLPDRKWVPWGSILWVPKDAVIRAEKPIPIRDTIRRTRNL